MKEQPDFGPSGYLPERAAKRARKIILRAPLGMHWIIATLVAGAVVLIASGLLLTRGPEAPGPPFVTVGSVDGMSDATFVPERGLLIVTGVGRIRAFAVDPGDVPIFCGESRRLESPSGRVFTVTGRALDGGDSLVEHPTIVVDGVVYVNPEISSSAGPSESTGAEPECTGSLSSS